MSASPSYNVIMITNIEYGFHQLMYNVSALSSPGGFAFILTASCEMHMDGSLGNTGGRVAVWVFQIRICSGYSGVSGKLGSSLFFD